MIWDDPWIVAATTPNPNSPFCTHLPPPIPVTPPDLTFDCRPMPPNIDEWIDLVGTRWTAEDVRQRLTGAWVPLVTDRQKGHLIGTCVLRPPTQQRPFWVLETLTVRQAGRGRGIGAFLMRAAMHWIWEFVGGPFQLAYTWELGLPQLLWAWWRGWLRSAVSIQRGWYWTAPGADCGFCPQAWKSVRADRLVLPTLIDRSVVVNDSGRGDDWGYVLWARNGVSIQWEALASRFGWKWLWYRGPQPPAGKGWQWTGEFVVVGLLNASTPPVSYEWITAEIA